MKSSALKLTLLLRRLTSFLFAFAVSQMAWGQAAAPAPPAKGKAPGPSVSGGGEKKKSLSFEDELVEGATSKPELFYLFQKKNFNYKRLIKLRDNFIPEMRRTSEEVQRGRSGN